MNPSVSQQNVQSLRCWVCSESTDLKCCSRCRSVYYCSKDHQQSDWSRHRTVCRPYVEPQMAAAPIAQTGVEANPIVGDTSLPHPGHMPPDSQNPMININSMNGLHPSNGLVDTNQNSELQLRQNLILSKLNCYCESIVRDLNEFGFCVIDDFLANGSEILDEVLFLYNHGVFKAGQVVNSKVSNTHLIRGDDIVWVDGTEQVCTNIGFLVQTLDSIVMRCNTMHTEGEMAKYRINRRTKAMIACYPGNNAKYVRHIDNPNNDGRCITSIYYLNKDYNRQRDGGVLRLFPLNTSCVADIEPKFNRVIFFWSDRRNPHEVMPSMRLRFAITVWYFDANERERALQRYRQQSLQYPVDKDLRPF